MFRGREAASIALVALSVGCSSDGEPAPAALECGLADPCGGNVVGTWMMSTFCSYLPNPFASSCPSSTYDATASGGVTWDLKADGSVAVTGSFQLAMALHLPTSCLGSSDCASLKSALDAAYPSAWTCSASSSACDCQVVDPVDASNAGTYATAGSTLAITSTDGTVAYAYCVRGGTLEMATSQNGVAVSMRGARQNSGAEGGT